MNEQDCERHDTIPPSQCASQEEHVKTFYVRDMYRNPIGMVAYVAKGKHVSYGYSVRNPEDKFSKKDAREEAIKRLMTAPKEIRLIDTIRCSILTDIALRPDNIPSRLRKVSLRRSRLF